MTHISTSEFPLEATCPDVEKLEAGNSYGFTFRPSEVPFEELMAFLRVESPLFGTCTVEIHLDLL